MQWYIINQIMISDDGTRIIGVSGCSIEEFRQHLVFGKFKDGEGRVLSDNFYWRGIEEGNYQSLLALPLAELDVQSDIQQVGDEWHIRALVTNKSDVPAMMVRLVAISSRSHQRILPVLYSDNYFFLMPGESKEVTVSMKVADCHGETPTITHLTGF